MAPTSTRTRLAALVGLTVSALALSACSADSDHDAPSPSQSSSSPSIVEAPAAGAPVSEAEGTHEDPHAADTTIEGSNTWGATFEVVIGEVERLDDDAVVALDERNEPAPDGMEYVGIPYTYTVVDRIDDASTTLAIGLEDEDGTRYDDLGGAWPDVWIDGDTSAEQQSTTMEVGDSLSAVSIVPVHEGTTGLVYLGLDTETLTDGLIYVSA